MLLPQSCLPTLPLFAFFLLVHRLNSSSEVSPIPSILAKEGEFRKAVGTSASDRVKSCCILKLDPDLQRHSGGDMVGGAGQPIFADSKDT